MTKVEEMKGPELVAHFNALATALGFKPVKKFETRTIALKRIAGLEAQAPVKKTKEEATVKTGKRAGKFAHRIVILNETPRREGTKAARLFAAMLTWVKKHPDATVAEVFKNTIYRPVDLAWDLRHGNVQKKD